MYKLLTGGPESERRKTSRISVLVELVESLLAFSSSEELDFSNLLHVILSLDGFLIDSVLQ